MEVSNKIIQIPSREEGELRASTKEDNASIKRPRKKKERPPKRH
jgi:hypothetical protein